MLVFPPSPHCTRRRASARGNAATDAVQHLFAKVLLPVEEALPVHPTNSLATGHWALVVSCQFRAIAVRVPGGASNIYEEKGSGRHLPARRARRLYMYMLRRHELVAVAWVARHARLLAPPRLEGRFRRRRAQTPTSPLETRRSCPAKPYRPRGR